MRTAIPLALLGLGGMITALDFTIVYVALPEIAREVGFSPHGLQWVVSAYAVPFGGFLLLGGRMADLLGRRRLFVAGMLLYGAGSLLGGLATAPAPLVVARAVQGLGGALLMPATLALVVGLFAEGPARNRAMAVWAVCGASGMSLGALLGGVLTGAFGWQAVFFVNVPLAAAGVLGAYAVLAPDGPRRTGGFDLPGALTCTAGVTGLVFAIAQGSEWGWTSPGVLVSLVAAVALLAGFVAIEARSRGPLLPLRLLAHRNTGVAAVAIGVYGFTLQCVPYFLTLHFQEVLGYDALRSGLAFLGPTLGIAAGNLLSERLIPRLGLRGTLIVAVLVGSSGTALLAAGLAADGSYLGVLAGVVGFGIGSGLSFATMFILVSTGVAGAEQGVVSGLASTLLQAGSAAGLAVLVAVADRDTAGLSGEAVRLVTTEGLRAAVFAAAAIALVGLPAALAVPGRKAAQAEPVETEPGEAEPAQTGPVQTGPAQAGL